MSRAIIDSEIGRRRIDKKEKTKRERERERESRQKVR